MKVKDSKFKAIYLAVLVGIVTTLTSLPARAAEDEKANPDGAKARQEHDLNARILDLQGTKDCIKNASTREAVAACQKTIKLKRDAQSPSR